MKKHQSFFLLGICLFIFAACSKDELFPDFIYEMTVSKEALNVVPDGLDETIEVNSNYEWSAESNAAWCKLSNASGSKGKSSLQVKVDKNVKIEERVAEVTITAGSVVRKIRVVQMNPDGFEIVDLPESVTVDGLENVITLQVKTNLQLKATAADGWVVSLNNDIIAGNPPQMTTVRVMFKDNTTSAPRTVVVKINGEGLPENFAKTFSVTQNVAPEANKNDSRIVGTWLATKVMNGAVSELSLLGATMKFDDEGIYSETLATGQKSVGTWEVRGDRIAIYYPDSRRYIYLTDDTDGISGVMTTTNIHSAVTYQTHLSTYSGDGFGVSLVDKTNTKLTYMMVINGDISTITECGLCIGKKENPTVADKKIVSKGGGAVVVGEVAGLLSGDDYHIRGYLMKGSQITYTANLKVDMPVMDVDGNNYKIVKIGQQYWLAENLRTTKYSDGTSVIYCGKNQNTEWTGASDAKQGAFSWIFGEEPDWVWSEDNFNKGVTDKRAKMYGAFYNWHAVVDKRKLAPEGWHVPTKEELVTLLNSIGASTDDFASGDMNYMNALLAHDHYPNLAGWNGWAVSGRGTDGKWKGWSSLSARETTWWSSDISEGGYPWLIYHRKGDSGDSGISWTYQGEGWTVRCVRDAE